jgi:hypothetical protein
MIQAGKCYCLLVVATLAWLLFTQTLDSHPHMWVFEFYCHPQHLRIDKKNQTDPENFRMLTKIQFEHVFVMIGLNRSVSPSSTWTIHLSLPYKIFCPTSNLLRSLVSLRLALIDLMKVLLLPSSMGFRNLWSASLSLVSLDGSTVWTTANLSKLTTHKLLSSSVLLLCTFLYF